METIEIENLIQGKVVNIDLDKSENPKRIVLEKEYEGKKKYYLFDVELKKVFADYKKWSDSI